MTAESLPFHSPKPTERIYVAVLQVPTPFGHVLCDHFRTVAVAANNESVAERRPAIDPNVKRFCTKIDDASGHGSNRSFSSLSIFFFKCAIMEIRIASARCTASARVRCHSLPSPWKILVQVPPTTLAAFVSFPATKDSTLSSEMPVESAYLGDPRCELRTFHLSCS